MSWIHAPQRREISRKNYEPPLRKLVVDSASANTRKTMTSGGSDAQSLTAVRGTTDNTSLQTLFQESKAFSHMAAYICKFVYIYIQIKLCIYQQI